MTTIDSGYKEPDARPGRPKRMIAKVLIVEDEEIGRAHV